ncbi:ABC-type antimicrobial peptide transport system, permease component [Mucilaginibacter pineti]|uniref:ABC-type antimicrobial peptide transport system, permease component n=1 Tax=Mucilaginibacter pineti TaxID=1391627 RepID=A0A1G7L827_9SPHI|nr:ABC transporter permease [Mucilaginibacter pineti]SDF45628.1 ABC-type antimicrobial peptide transport system, permease component [Mucilaginibacter pineti]
MNGIFLDREWFNTEFMLKNYIKLAFRNLKSKKVFSFINITGLAVGMAGAILNLLWVQNEYSYDAFHSNNKTLCKVWNRYISKEGIGASDVTSSPVGQALKAGFPEVKNSARIYWTTDRLFNYKDASLKAKGNDVDKAFLTMFSFPLVQGNAAHALDDVNSIVLTEQLAKKIFKDTDPLNQLVRIDNKQAYKVTGILKDLPNNTEFDFEYLVSLAANEKFYTDGSWGNNSYYTYVQLQPGTDIGRFNQKIKEIAKQHDPTGSAHTEVFLYPFSRMHLYGKFENGQPAGGRIEVVHLLLGIAALILLIACINFMNLSTAQSQKRAREVGVRKVMGAVRTSLVFQFLTESLAMTSISGLLALLIAQLGLPAFNELTGKQLFISYGNPVYWLAFVGFILLTGLLAGSYPAFFLSAFRPVKTLKGGSHTTNTTFNPRKVLVVLQFSVSIILVISAIVIYRQIDYAQNRDTGYDIDHLVQVPVEGDIRKNYALIKNDLIVSGVATAMCQTSLDVTVDGATSGGFSIDGSNKDQQNISFSRFGTSGDFIKTMGLTLTNGRDIDFNSYPSDSLSCMLNETAVKQLGLKDPVGNFIKNGTSPIKVVGVFKDFIIQSPYVNTGPMIVLATKKWIYNTVIRLNGQTGTAHALQLAEDIFKKYNPAYPFTYHFVDSEYQQKFNDQQQTGKLAAIFAGLTIFISCLGLFGLASYMAENRAKEIGIRKVLGASVAGITRMLTGDFAKLVAIAIFIAVPVSWLLMNKWLQDFTYRIGIGWQPFVLSGASAIAIAVLTVSFQSIKAARANPVDSIKPE